MINGSKKTFDNTNSGNEVDIIEMAEYCANQAAILQKKAFNILKDIDPDELSASDARFFIREGVKLERTSIESLFERNECKIKYRAEHIYQQHAVLKRLKQVNVELLNPIPLVKYCLTAISIERVCRGLPELKI